MEAVDVLSLVVRANPNIAGVTTFIAPPARAAANPILDGADPTVANALTLRGAHSIPFWDAFFAVLPGSHPRLDHVLLRAMEHNEASRNKRNFSRKEVLSGVIHDYIRNASGDLMVVASSHVTCTDGDDRHIPMLDFHRRASAENERLVSSVVRALKRTGFLLESGKSYHFWGDTLLSQSSLVEFLGKSLLFAPVVDRAWLAHQLIEGACGLRLSGRPGYGGPPKMVAKIAET